jgi:hypothetical protein
VIAVILAGRITGEAREVAGESDIENVNKQATLTILAITLHHISPEQNPEPKPVVLTSGGSSRGG